MSEHVVAVLIEPEALVFGFALEGVTRLERWPLPEAGVTASDVATWLQQQGLTPGPVVVGLSSRLCFAAELETDGLPRMGRDAALRYRLEAKLPDDLETLSVVFVGTHRDQALAVAARDEAWRPAAEALGEAGFELRCVTPTALLCAAATSLSGGDVLVQADPAGVDHLTFDGDGQLMAWRFVPAHPKEVAASLGRGEGGRVAVLGVSSGVLPDQAGVDRAEEADTPDVALHAALRRATDVLAGETAVALNFIERDTSAGRALRAWTPAFAAAAVVGWVLAGVMFFVGAQQQQAADQARADLREAYVELFPGQRVPAVLVPRLRSEVAALTSSDTLAGERDALADVLGLVLRMPGEGGYEILEIAADSTSIRVVGEASSLGAIDGIAQVVADHPAAVSGGGTLPPTTQVMPSGRTRFELRIDTATRNAAAGVTP